MGGFGLRGFCGRLGISKALTLFPVTVSTATGLTNGFNQARPNAIQTHALLAKIWQASDVSASWGLSLLIAPGAGECRDGFDLSQVRLAGAKKTTQRQAPFTPRWKSNGMFGRRRHRHGRERRWNSKLSAAERLDRAP